MHGDRVTLTDRLGGAISDTARHDAVSDTAGDAVRYETDGPVGRLTLNRPGQRNSFTDELLRSLLRAVERAVSDDTVRVLLLTGSGSAFSVGGDLNEFAAGKFRPEGVPITASVERLRRFMHASELLRRSDKVTIAAVNGACAGAGFSIAAACDIRVASTDAVFRTSFLDAGLSGDFGGTWLLTRLLGEARARELYLLNDKITAERAQNIGLVSWTEAPERFGVRVSVLAASLAGKAPIALQAIKRNFNDLPIDFADACDLEARRQIECAYTADAVEAARAFLQKRQPVYVGG
ncbi:enoyl-CoA hydratase-related protein [Saxibacter everestensis]|uniref:Enoyl-CoA hydratase-related protein n=1 Tax=Saxibacter everestensis TaxID=2909229 RepID=A0ABY8QSX6_9MICO|nr:enoyl-CoA hydratase-related protein [Brevibacteriaceae bacterium ZFBP1038]